MHPIPPPKKLPIDLTSVETAKGSWGIFVENIVETRAGQNLLVKIILEQTVDDEKFRMRNLEILVNAQAARDSDHASDIAGQIKCWIESTDGDGYVDIANLSN
jgi:hypothetical protein